MCLCDCGNTVPATAQELNKGDKTHCGCSRKYKNYVVKKLVSKEQKILHSRWKNMIQRCTNPNMEQYHNYGGRGISVCDEWRIFDNFYDWAINNGFSEELTIDRINVNGNYEPSNCRWATDEIQNANKRTNVYLTYKDVTLTATQWSKIIGCNRNCISNRKRLGLNDFDCIVGTQKIKREENIKKLNSYFKK